MVYVATLSESKGLMCWRLILDKFGPNIRHIYGVDNIVADNLSRLPYIFVNKYKPSTSKYQYCVNELFKMGREENNEDSLPLNLLNMQREQQKELRNRNSKLRTYISYWVSGYSKQAL